MVLRLLTAGTLAPECQAGTHNDKEDSTSMRMTQQPSQEQPDTGLISHLLVLRRRRERSLPPFGFGIWGAEISLNQALRQHCKLRSAPAQKVAARAQGITRQRSGCLGNAHMPPQGFPGIVVRRRPRSGYPRGRDYNSQEAARRGRGLAGPAGAGAWGLGGGSRKMARWRVASGLPGLPALPLLLLLLPLLVLGPWRAAGHGGKYSREKNEPERPPKREPGGEFRMEKLNQLWEKAQRVSGGRGPCTSGVCGAGVSCTLGGGRLLYLGGPRAGTGGVIPALVRRRRSLGFGVP